MFKPEEQRDAPELDPHAHRSQRTTRSTLVCLNPSPAPWRRRVERVTGKIMLGARDCTERRADQMQKNPKIGW